MTTGDVARRFRISRDLVQQFIRAGQLRATKSPNPSLVGYRWQITEEDLQFFLNTRKNTAVMPGGRILLSREVLKRISRSKNFLNFLVKQGQIPAYDLRAPGATTAWWRYPADGVAAMESCFRDIDRGGNIPLQGSPQPAPGPRNTIPGVAANRIFKKELGMRGEAIYRELHKGSIRAQKIDGRWHVDAASLLTFIKNKKAFHQNAEIPLLAPPVIPASPQLADDFLTQMLFYLLGTMEPAKREEFLEKALALI